MIQNKTYQCHYCDKQFNDIKELALHIMASTGLHYRGHKFASTILTDVNRLNKKVDVPKARIPLTEQEKENKCNCQRDLSGENKFTITFCPICKKTTQQSLPIEFVISNNSWRNKNGYLMVDCQYCLKSKKKF